MTPFRWFVAVAALCLVGLLFVKPAYERMRNARDESTAHEVIDTHLKKMHAITEQRLLELGKRVEAKAHNAGLCPSFAKDYGPCSVTAPNEGGQGSFYRFHHDPIQRRVAAEWWPHRVMHYHVQTGQAEKAQILLSVEEIHYAYEYDAAEGKLYYFAPEDRRRLPVTESFYKQFLARHGIAYHLESSLFNYVSYMNYPPFLRQMSLQLLQETGLANQRVSCPDIKDRKKIIGNDFELWCYVDDATASGMGAKKVRLSFEAPAYSVGQPVPFLN